MSITHVFVNAKADGADTSLVRPSNWNAGHSIHDLLFDADNTYDIGAAAASRPANVFVGSSLIVSGLVTAKVGIALGTDLGQDFGAVGLAANAVYARIWRASTGNDQVINLLTNRDLIIQNNGTEVGRLTGLSNVWSFGTATGGKFVAAGTLTGGGLVGSALQVGTSGPLIYSGSGVPSISAAVKGSLYLRSDGSGTTNRIYVAKDTAGAWASLTAAS